MALIQSPNIVRSGLVYHVDAANIKTFLGEVTTNLVPNPDLSAGTTNWSLYSGGGTTTIAAVAVTDVPRTYGTSRNVLQCNTSTTLNGGGTYGGASQSGFSFTAGLSYTISYYARSLSGTLTVRFSNQTGSGDESNLSHDITVTDAWTKFTRTVTLDLAKSQTLIYNKNGSVAGGIFQIADMQIEQKAYATNFVNGSRGTTVAAGGGFADLTANDIDGTLVNAPTYNSAFGGSIVFDGANTIITAAENSALNTQTPTVEVWIKTNNLNQNGFFFEKGNVNTQYSLFQEGTNIVWRQNVGTLISLNTVTATYIGTSAYAQIVGTFTTGDRRTYINGAQVNSDTQAGTISTNAKGISIGAFGGVDGSVGGRGYYFNGNIAIIRVYNRVLSATEIRQNFEAQRTRFNV